MFTLPVLNKRQATTAAPPNQLASDHQELPITAFKRHFVAADGNCLFRAIYMGLQGARSQASNGDILNLRQRVSTYIEQHRLELENNPYILGRDNLQSLQDLLPCLGQWSGDAGDLVPPLLAQVLGRQIIILQTLPGENTYRLKQDLPANSPELPAVAAHPMAENTPIYLAHIAGGTHYEYLEPRSTHTSGNIPTPTPAPQSTLTTAEIMSPSRDSEPANKRARTTIKTEATADKTTPPLIPFAKAARFYASSYIDLTRATINLTDASGSVRDTLPVSLIPNADINRMSQLPIIQSPEDPRQAHTSLPQPVAINPHAALRQNSNNAFAINIARDKIDALLKDPQQRKKHEQRYFKIAKIRSKHLSRIGTEASQHPTLTMRGVIAAEHMPIGTPLQYSGQYLDKNEYTKTIDQLSQELQTKTSISALKAEREARRLITAYTWENITYKGKRYDISSFGAGNTTAVINHDEQQPNMGVAYMSTYDSKGQPAPQVVVYFALRNIEKDEQLLVNYGEHYHFNEPTEGSMDIAVNWPDSLLSAPLLEAQSSVKAEACHASTSHSEPEISAASILLELATAQTQATVSIQHSINQPSPPDKTWANSARQQAFTTFNRSIQQRLSESGKRQDAYQHAELFFQQLPLHLIKARDLVADQLFRIIENNEPGSLGELCSNWKTLNQRDPAITLLKLINVAKNFGGINAINTLKQHWPILTQIFPTIAPVRLLDIANDSVSSKAMYFIKDNWDALKQLKPPIASEKLLTLANHSNGYKILDYIKVNWDKLNELQPPILAEKLFEIAHNRGTVSLEYIQNSWTQLNNLHPTMTPEKILDMANSDEDCKSLSYLLNNWTTLKNLQPTIAPADLINIASNSTHVYSDLDYIKNHWATLNNLQPNIPPDKLLKIFNSNGGNKTIHYIETHWRNLNQLKPAIAANDLINIASKAGSSNALAYIEKHWANLNQLQPAIAPERLLKIANNNGGATTLEYIHKQWQALNQLQPPISLTDLLAIASHHGGSKTLSYILNNWVDLNKLKPAIAQVDLISIADNGGGRKNLSYIKTHWHKLNQLQPKISPKKLLKIINHTGGSKTIDYLHAHWSTLNQLQPTITANDLIDIASTRGGSNILEYIAKNWQAMSQLQPAITPAQILMITTHSGGAKTLEYIHKQWLSLNQMQPPIPIEKLLNIASHDGGSKALDIFKKNWDRLSSFTNNHGEKITIEQLENICSRKVASKRIDILLNNTHIKELSMNEIIYILVDDRRTNKFISDFPH